MARLSSSILPKTQGKYLSLQPFRGNRGRPLHLKLYILFARATSEITKDIHLQSHARRRLLFACSATQRFNNLYDMYLSVQVTFGTKKTFYAFSTHSGILLKIDSK